jgi:RNA polymerase primary sigma factor
MIFQLLQKERSIDDFIDKEDGCRLGTVLADGQSPTPEDEIYSREISGLVREAMVQLDYRERHIIRNRFGLNGGDELTLEEIGRKLHLSRERVRQLEREAKDKIRAKLARFQPQIRYSMS